MLNYAETKMREMEARDVTEEVRTDFETQRRSLYESISAVEITLSDKVPGLKPEEKIKPHLGTTTTSLSGGARGTTMMAKQKPPLFDGQILGYADLKKRWEATVHASRSIMKSVKFSRTSQSCTDPTSSHSQS